MRRALLLIGLVSGIGLGLWWGAHSLIQARVAAVLAQVPSSAVSYGHPTVHVLRRQLAFRDVRVTSAAGPAAHADQLKLTFGFARTAPYLELVRIEADNLILASGYRAGSVIVTDLPSALWQSVSTGQLNSAAVAGSRILIQALEVGRDGERAQLAELSAAVVDLTRLRDIHMKKLLLEGQSQLGPWRGDLADVQLAEMPIQSPPIESRQWPGWLITQLMASGGAVLGPVRLSVQTNEVLALDSVRYERSAQGTDYTYRLSLPQGTVDLAPLLLQPWSSTALPAYQKLQVKLDALATYSSRADILDLKTLAVDFKEALSLELTGTLHQLARSFPDPEGNAYMDILSNLSVGAAEFRLRDQGAISRYVDAEAKRLEITPAVFVEQWVEDFAPAIGNDGVGAKRIGMLYRAVADQMMNKGQLVLSIDPKPPAPLFEFLGGLKSPGPMLERLGFKARNEHNPAQP